MFVDVFSKWLAGEKPLAITFFTAGAIMQHVEKHRTNRIGWLRAAVLGANDGIVSTASLVVGVAVHRDTS